MGAKWQRLWTVAGSSLLLWALYFAGVLSSSQAASPSHISSAVQHAALDVVINEIAWMGTAASYYDEWIELYNNTPQTVSLDSWRLYAADGGPTLTLNGHIGPHGYYLLERTDDTTISDIPGDWVHSFTGGSLHNDGEYLILEDASGHAIDTVDGNDGWPAGDNISKTTMERLSPIAPGSRENWASNDSTLHRGLDADGHPISGTPRAMNAVYVADLEVVKTGPVTVTAGHTLTYALHLTNLGPRLASHVLLTDNLPSAVEVYTHTGTPAATLLLQSKQHIVWRLGDMASQDAYTLTVTAHITDTATGRLTNWVTTTTKTRETHTRNNYAHWSTQVQRSTGPTQTVPTQTLYADLAIDKTGPLTLRIGSRITYHVHIQNLGMITATHCRITDTLPPEISPITAHSSLSTVQVISNAPTLAWDIAILPPSATLNITLTAHGPARAISTPLRNVIAASTQITEHTLDNNSAEWSTTVYSVPPPTPPTLPSILINGVLYKGYQTNQPDEAVQLVNTGAITAQLDGWELCEAALDGARCVPLPIMTLMPGQRIWLTKNAAAFSITFGLPADAELTRWLRLADDGGEIILRDAAHTPIDTLVYKDGQTPIAGWTGPGVQPAAVGRETGQILSRIPDEHTGLPVTDTHTAADWLQSTANVTYGRRALYPGWDMDPLFWPLSVTQAATVVVGIAPDNAFHVISQTVMRARRHISIEIYTLRSPALIELLIQQAQAGTHVSLLLEGSPLGVGTLSPEWQTQLYACQALEATGNGQCWFMIHESADNIYNRYSYIHAKLMIVDNAWAVVSAQNFTPSSLPADDKSNGTAGTRGALIATNAPAVVARAADIFRLDADPTHADVLRWNTGYVEKYGPPVPELVDLRAFDPLSYTVRVPQPLVVSGTFGFELFTAPEAALRHTDALLGLIHQAGPGDTVYVQQLYEHWAWGEHPDSDPNLRLAAYLQAAQRGAKVRLLLNRKSFIEGFNQPPEDNVQTLAYVNQYAQQHALNLQAALGDPTGSGIHNKMVLVDLHDRGKFSHIGSINGSEASSKLNREVALQVRSEAVYEYLAAAFALDWWDAHPILLPYIMRSYTPPAPPVPYPVISEVYYAGDANGEWIEIYNPTQHPVDMSSYQVGDYDGAGFSEGLYAFPTTATLPAGEVWVIAGDARQVHPPADYEFFSNNPDIPTLQKSGGDGDWALGNTGDQVLLLDPSGQPVDIVVWGQATYPGIVPHPGVTLTLHSLERYPAYYDTEDCAHDFRDRYPPSPGVLPGE